MKLVPFSPQYLRLEEPLPFGLRDMDGRLLLGAGLLLHGKAQLDELSGLSLFVDESEAAAWMRRLNAARDAAIRQGVSMQKLAATRPDAPREGAPQAKALTLAEQWQELVDRLDAALRDMRAGSEWRARVQAVHAQAREVFQRRPDASLYLLVYEAAHSTQKYSSHHALLTMLITEQAATMLAWEVPRIDCVGLAALVMNVAMQRLQDQLAVSTLPLSADVRAQIDAHPQAGAKALEEAGLDDALCAAVVRLHHDAGEAETALSALSPERQLARLLRRVDIFAAKISRRASRPPMSPVQAAREACMGPGGVPDEIGGALLKAVGLYPPGSFVELVNGEMGIVVARGRRANLPFVASLMSGSGNLLGEPLLRDTIERRFAVKAAVAPAMVRVRPPHDRLLAMR